MNLLLTRQPADGKSVRGLLTSPEGEKLHVGSDPTCSYAGTTSRSSTCSFPTLENADYLIPADTYPVSVTMSPKFKRPLPLLSGVPVAGSGPETLRKYGHSPGTSPSSEGAWGCRSGIRIHRGTRPEHSTGCILVAPKDEPTLVNLLRGQSHTLTIK